MKEMLFINCIFNQDWHGLIMWFSVVAIMALMPIVASVFDLHYGILKSKKMGTFKTTSQGLKRTVDKDVTYLSFYFLITLIDGCLSFLIPFPILCVICAIAELLIEIWSIHENFAEARVKGHDPLDVAVMIAKVYGADKLPELGQILQDKNVLNKIKEVNDAKN
jgi:hypothetical protein